MFISIGENDRDWEKDLEGFKFIGTTRGCGCCSTTVGLTPENLDGYIQELEQALEEARAIRAKL